MALVPSLALDVLDEEPLPRAGKGLFSGAVFASLGLHSAVFSGLLSISLLPPPADESERRQTPSIAITLINRSGDAEISTGTALDILRPESLENSEGSAAPISSQDIPGTDTVVTTPAINNPAPAGNRPDLPEDSTSEQTRVNAPRQRAEVLALVNSSIASFKVENRQVLNQDFVESCLRYRNRYGPNRDCPESFSADSESAQQEKALAEKLFANSTRDADQARLSRKIERENTLLEGIMDAGGPAGEQAEIRWRLNRQYHAYLNDNIHPELTWASQTAMVNDYGRTVPPGPFQFRCKEWPCVYQYTGFEVKRPTNYVEKVPAFVVLPPLFTGSNN